MGTEGVEFRRKRFVHCTLSLDDVKDVKNAMKCTVNDVCVGWSDFCCDVAVLPPQDHDANNENRNQRKHIRVRAALLVNIRKAPGLHVLAEMMSSSKSNAARWGNLIGYIVLPFRIAMYDDPLEYIRQGKRTVDRKKSSLEAVFTYWSGNLIVKLFGIMALTVHYQSYMNTVKLVLAVDDAEFPDAHQLQDVFAESLRLIRQAASTKS